ncbi:MAG: TonB-dependent receptor, partial [Myxococcota bacterium]
DIGETLLRIASPQNQPVEYIAGIFLWRATAERSFTRDDIVCTGSSIPVNPEFNAAPCIEGASMLTFPTSTADMTSGFTNIGVFAQSTAHLSQDLRFVLGGRYVYDLVEFTHQRPAAEVGGPGVRDVANDLADSTENQNATAKLALQYDLTDTIMAYGSFSRGYKGPAYNVFYNMGPNNRLPIAPETSNAYELGLKSTLINRRLNLNITGYFARYQDFQANNFVFVDGAITTTLTNAGKVQTAGAEVDLIAFPAPWLRLIGGLAYTRATIVEFNADPSDRNASDRNGDPLPLAPELKFSLSGDVNFPIDFGVFEIITTIRSQFAFTSQQFSDIGNASTGTRWPIDAYALWHASVGFSDSTYNHQVNFIVRNILDSSFVTLNTGAGSRLHIPRDADRYFGVNYTASY